MEKKVIITGNEIKEIKLEESAKICYRENNDIYIIDSNRKLHKIKINEKQNKKKKKKFRYRNNFFFMCSF